jgi:hypothetical protein
MIKRYLLTYEEKLFWKEGKKLIYIKLFSWRSHLKAPLVILTVNLLIHHAITKILHIH